MPTSSQMKLCVTTVTGFLLSSIVIGGPSTHGNRSHPDENEMRIVRVPKNTDLDWEVDQLHRVRLMGHGFAADRDISEADVNLLVTALRDPKTYVGAHVLLSLMYDTPSHSHATAVPGGFDIWYSGLNVELRYSAEGTLDKKSVLYPVDDRRSGTQRARIAALWKQRINAYQRLGISRDRRARKHHAPMLPAWCDSRSYDLKGVTNARLVWRTVGFGTMHPMLLKVHREEIARGNTTHVAHLLRLLRDKSRFAAAHVALSRIYGVDSFTARITSKGLDAHVNGLHTLIGFDKQRGQTVAYPNQVRQQAWLQYRWNTVVHRNVKRDGEQRGH